jgi:hypothetical protein
VVSGENALNAMIVKVSLTPAKVCSRSVTKWPISTLSAEFAFDHDEDGLHRILPRWGRIIRRSGLGGNLRRAPQKRGEIIAEADDAMLGLALSALWPARGIGPALGGLTGEHSDIVFGDGMARFRRDGACGLSRAPLFTGFVPARSAGLPRRGVAAGGRSATAAAIALLEVQLGCGDAVDLYDRDVLADQRLDRGDVLAVLGRR